MLFVLFADNSQRQVQISRHYRPCPMRLIPKYPSTTDATSTGNSFADRWLLHKVFYLKFMNSVTLLQDIPGSYGYTGLL